MQFSLSILRQPGHVGARSSLAMSHGQPPPGMQNNMFASYGQMAMPQVMNGAVVRLLPWSGLYHYCFSRAMPHSG